MTRDDNIYQLKFDKDREELRLARLRVIKAQEKLDRFMAHKPTIRWRMQRIHELQTIKFFKRTILGFVIFMTIWTIGVLVL